MENAEELSLLLQNSMKRSIYNPIELVSKKKKLSEVTFNRLSNLKARVQQKEEDLCSSPITFCSRPA